MKKKKEKGSQPGFVGSPGSWFNLAGQLGFYSSWSFTLPESVQPPSQSDSKSTCQADQGLISTTFTHLLILSLYLLIINYSLCQKKSLTALFHIRLKKYTKYYVSLYTFCCIYWIKSNWIKNIFKKR